jgi:tRNA (cytidine/uridine-2'-O-)-methyltransferase
MSQDSPLQSDRSKLRLGFYQPDIPQNLGASLRLGACFGVPVDIIEPCGFPLTDKSLRRAAMDYAGRAEIVRHDSWARFLCSPPRREGRLVLFSTSGAIPLDRFSFQPGDTLLFGRESAGVPEEVRLAAEASVIIPMVGGARSLNVAMSAGIALWEGLRQTDGFPVEGPPPDSV